MEADWRLFLTLGQTFAVDADIWSSAHAVTVAVTVYDNFLGAPIAIPDPRSVFPDPVLQSSRCPRVHNRIYAAVVDTRQHAAAENPCHTVSENQCNDPLTLILYDIMPFKRFCT